MPGRTLNPRAAARTIDRSFERRIVLVGILVAAAYLFGSLAALALPDAVRRGPWLPLHLALAGGAGTAISAVMPFFVAAFAAVPPADPRLRSAAVALVAAGASGIVAGVDLGAAPLAALSGGVYVGGIGLTALAVMRPVGRSLGPSRGLVTRAYLLALGHVAAGGILASLLLAGWPPVAGAWPALKPAHGWLNLVGFVSLVIATTLLHFFPTVVGARIAARRSATLAVVGLAAGTELVALGYVAGLELVPRLGGGLAIAGMAGLVANARAAWATRGRWTTDLAWHRFAIGGLGSAIAWFAVGIVVMAGRVIVLGAVPAAWEISEVAGPLVVGWTGFSILAAATHLLPSVGPGSPAAHAVQRQVLGRWSAVRLAVLNVGCVALSAGLVLRNGVAVGAGAALLAIGVAATVGLLAVAAGRGIREGRRR